MPFIETHCCPCPAESPCGCPATRTHPPLQARIFQVLAPDTLVCGCLVTGGRWTLAWNDRQNFWVSGMSFFCGTLGERRGAIVSLHCLPQCGGSPGVQDYVLVVHSDCTGEIDSFAWSPRVPPTAAPVSTCTPFRLVFEVTLDRACCTATAGGAVRVLIEVTL